MTAPGAGGTVTSPAAGSTTKGKPAAPAQLAPFVKGAYQHNEPFGQGSQQLDGSQHVFGPVDVPAYGFLRDIAVVFTATGGADSGETVAVKADAPWCAIDSVQLTDVNGQPIIGPLSGYTWYLINKYGGYAYMTDPALSPAYTAPVVGASASGNFAFLLRIPVEITERDAFGSLPNQNAASTYKIQFTVAASTAIYSTAPDTLPLLAWTMFLEAWSQPQAVDLRGQPQATVPPAMGSSQFWSRFIKSGLAAGQQTVQLVRVGNWIRNLIFVNRDSNGARTAASWPASMQLLWDGRILLNEAVALRQDTMQRRYGFQVSGLDTGVIVIDFCHDLDGHVGDELRDGYLPTTQATRLEVEGTFGASASSLEVVTNDVAPTAEFQVL
jgi:hypothetical protein